MEKTKILILAGGFGTRLRSVVSDVPKPLAPINGKPFLYYLLELRVKQGLSDFVFLLHHQSEQMIQFIESIKDTLLYNSNVSWVVEPEPLGTGGAVAYTVKSLSIQESFLVANADTWLGGGISELCQCSENTIAVVHVDNTSRYGKVKIEKGLITEFLEKKESSGNGWINAGLYKLSAKPFEDWNGKPFSIEQRIFPELVSKQTLKAIQLDADFIDIGIPDDYHRFINWVKIGKVK